MLHEQPLLGAVISMFEPQKVSLFTRFSKTASSAAGKPLTFVLAVLLIFVWGVSERSLVSVTRGSWL